MSFRIGFGIDFHQLVKGRELWIGGVKIPFEKGAMGHSDADVLLHAICDGLLGAAALGDIGQHFPNNDPEYKNIDSKILLKKTYGLIKEQQFKVINIDCTVCLENPKIMDHAGEMRRIIGEIVEVGANVISIKATTTEQMGSIGRGEGLAAYASVLLEKKEG